ncbi:MAG: Rrf2 family transcriptional regulator [Sphingosinicella sp.]|nr:Rrf2 family transcriptional regulator [Sphingosinicella sp.]
MRLTRYTDYAVRVLMHLAVHPDRLCSIGEIADAYAISRNHLMKIVNDLANAGYVASERGRFGGIRLARPAAEIGIGELVRHTEGEDALADCGGCIVAPACGLTGALGEALGAFMAVLDGYSLADITRKRAALGALLGVAA